MPNKIQSHNMERIANIMLVSGCIFVAFGLAAFDTSSDSQRNFGSKSAFTEAVSSGAFRNVGKISLLVGSGMILLYAVRAKK